MSDYLTRQAILQRFHSCKYRKKLETKDSVSGVAHNPLCGDTITLAITIHNYLITDIGFQAVGCVISQVSASVFCEQVHTLSIQKASLIMVHDIMTPLGITLGLTRLKCATLALGAFKHACERYQRDSTKDAQSR